MISWNKNSNCQVRDPEDHAGAPADVPEELQEEEPQPSLIAQAMRDAGLDEISLTDLANGREGQVTLINLT